LYLSNIAACRWYLLVQDPFVFCVWSASPILGASFIRRVMGVFVSWGSLCVCFSLLFFSARCRFRLSTPTCLGAPPPLGAPPKSNIVVFCLFLTLWVGDICLASVINGAYFSLGWAPPLDTFCSLLGVCSHN